MSAISQPTEYRSAKDIPDADFIAALEAVSKSLGSLYASRWDIGAVLGGFAPRTSYEENLPAEVLGVPEKVVLAKARKLVRRGLISGCVCGCRGDFTVTEARP
jgi:hypothetical protein